MILIMFSFLSFFNFQFWQTYAYVLSNFSVLWLVTNLQVIISLIFYQLQWCKNPSFGKFNLIQTLCTLSVTRTSCKSKVLWLKPFKNQVSLILFLQLGWFPLSNGIGSLLQSLKASTTSISKLKSIANIFLSVLRGF